MLLVNACTVIYICLYGYRRSVIICQTVHWSVLEIEIYETRVRAGFLFPNDILMNEYFFVFIGMLLNIISTEINILIFTR